MKRILPPTLLVISISLMCLIHFMLPLLQIISYPLNLIGAVPIVIGIVITLAGSNMFKAADTTEMTFDEPSTLVTSGIYKISRNPVYLGFALMIVGVGIMLGSAISFVVAIAFIITTDRWYISYEEKMLKEKFGKDYLIYKSKVRRWM